MLGEVAKVQTEKNTAIRDKGGKRKIKEHSSFFLNKYNFSIFFFSISFFSVSVLNETYLELGDKGLHCIPVNVILS